MLDCGKIPMEPHDKYFFFPMEKSITTCVIGLVEDNIYRKPLFLLNFIWGFPAKIPLNQSD
jgi:hypothetical protein